MIETSKFSLYLIKDWTTNISRSAHSLLYKWWGHLYHSRLPVRNRHCLGFGVFHLDEPSSRLYFPTYGNAFESSCLFSHLQKGIMLMFTVPIHLWKRPNMWPIRLAIWLWDHFLPHTIFRRYRVRKKASVSPLSESCESCPISGDRHCARLRTKDIARFNF